MTVPSRPRSVPTVRFRVSLPHRIRTARLVTLAALAWAVAGCSDEPATTQVHGRDTSGARLDAELQIELALMGVDGRIEETFVERLGRPIDQDLAETGRLLFFDPILSLTQDNSCSGCHGPNVAFNDSKSISVGVDNNGIVGPNRRGPFNLRRAPTVLNAAFYPNLMWDGRFASVALDGFDNSQGFVFPEPEGTSLSDLEHLLVAQAFTPVVAREEMAGFEFQGSHDEMRAEIASRVDAVEEYRSRLALSIPEVAAGDPVTYTDIARALAEFQFTLIRADAPIDAYARGDTSATSPSEKRGALLFFRDPAACFECHITLGYANQMFSDFDSHAIAVPQIAPVETNAAFDGPGSDEDFGRERSTGDAGDRYKFRTTPLRNVAYQPSFMHNGAYVCLDEAIRHHLEMERSLETFSGEQLEASLRSVRGPDAPMIQRAHHLSRNPRGTLTVDEYDDLLSFVAISLSDPDAAPEALRSLVPERVPSGLPVHDFEFGTTRAECR